MIIKETGGPLSGDSSGVLNNADFQEIPIQTAKISENIGAKKSQVVVEEQHVINEKSISPTPKDKKGQTDIPIKKGTLKSGETRSKFKTNPSIFARR